MNEFGCLVGLVWAETCDFGSDLGRGRPQVSPWAKFSKTFLQPHMIYIFAAVAKK